MRTLSRCQLASILFLFCAPAWSDAKVRVFAAASLATAMEEIAERWSALGHPAPILALGASSVLARQIEAGAPAHVFASADPGWMEYVRTRGRIEPDTRIALLGNSLVLIAPKGKGFPVQMHPGFALAAAFEGRLCTGEPGSVPAGIYARQSLQALGWWKPLQGRIVGTDDVRAALAFVGRGECAAGIVYATDAAISDAVEVLARFPAESHARIVYVFAVIRGAPPQARAFLDFARNAPEAGRIFMQHGFTLPLERGNWVGSVRLWNPTLHLDDSNRVGLELSLQASTVGLPLLRGRSHFDGELDFRRETGELFVRNVSVRDLDIVGLPPRSEASLRGLVELIGEAAFARTPIYRVDPHRRGYRLESAEVRDGKLVIGVRRR